MMTENEVTTNLVPVVPFPGQDERCHVVASVEQAYVIASEDWFYGFPNPSTLPDDAYPYTFRFKTKDNADRELVYANAAALKVARDADIKRFGDNLWRVDAYYGHSRPGHGYNSDMTGLATKYVAYYPLEVISNEGHYTYNPNPKGLRMLRAGERTPCFYFYGPGLPAPTPVPPSDN